MPDPFNGSGGFEEILGQYNTAAYWSGLYRPISHENWPQKFAICLKGKALHFFYVFNYLVLTMITKCTTKVKILKTRLKAARQQPGQNFAFFLCDIRTLACRACHNYPHLLERIVTTIFMKGLKNSTFGGTWETCNLRTLTTLWQKHSSCRRTWN